MIDLPNTEVVKDLIHAFLRYRKPPMVSYSYTKTISSRIFNQKSVVEDMCCDCSTCAYCYEPAGHVVTGDVTISKRTFL